MDNARHDVGFALVSVLAILALILVLVLSISSVLHVETRTSASAKNVLLARQNALLGLDTAIAQLQQYAGKDQAVTFPATTFYPTKNTANATGELFDMYRSAAATSPRKTYLTPAERANWDNAIKAWWNANRNPRWTGIADASLRRDGTPSDKFGEPKRDQLPVWLVSGNEKFTINGTTSSYPSGYLTPNMTLGDPASDDTVVWLVGNGTVSSTNGTTDGMEPRVKVKKVALQNATSGNTTATGHYAYWVGDESTKANFAVIDPWFDVTTISSPEYRNRLQVPQRVGWENIAASASGNATLSANASFAVNDSRLLNIGTSKEIALVEASANNGNTSKTASFQESLKNNFHSLTAFSRSLLTDTALGGLKKDLTVFFEGSGSGISDSDPIPNRSLYHFNDPRFGGNNTGFPATASTTGLPTWGHLKRWHDNDQSELGPVLAHYQLFMAFTHRNGEVQFHLLPLFFLWNPYDVALAPATYTLEMRHNIGLWHFGFAVENNAYSDPTPADVNDGHKVGTYFIPPLAGAGWFNTGSPDYKRRGTQIRTQDTWSTSGNYPGNRFAPFDRGSSVDGVEPLLSGNDTWVPYRITSGFAPGEVKVFSVGTSQQVDPIALHNKSQSVTLENIYDPNFPASYWFPIINGLNREPGTPANITDNVRWYADRLQGNTPRTISARLLRGGNMLWEVLFTGTQDNTRWITNAVWDPGTNVAANPATWKTAYYFASPTEIILPEQEQYIWNLKSKSLSDQRSNTSPIQALAGNRVVPFTPSGSQLVANTDNSISQGGHTQYVRYFASHNPSAVKMDPIPEIELARDGVGNNNQDGFQTVRWWVSARGDTFNNWNSNQVTGDNGFALLSWQNQDTTLNHRGLTNLQMRLARANFNLLSLGQLQQANVAEYSWQPAFAIGNSEATPYVDRARAAGLQSYQLRNATGTQHFLLNMNQRAPNTPMVFPNDSSNRFIDLSFVLNENLWDRYFLSSIPQSGALNTDNSGPLPNSRHRFVDSPAVSEVRNFDTASAHLENVGALNVNSTAVEAWKALLTAFRNLAIQGDGQRNPANTVPVSRNMTPLAGPIDFTDSTRTQAHYGANSSGDRRYEKIFQGFRFLTDVQIQRLAERIVDEIRLRGPFYSLADFVNRRLVSPDGAGQPGSPWMVARTSNQHTSATSSGGNFNSTHTIPTSYNALAGLSGINGAIQRAINVSGINGGINYPFADDENDRVFRVDADLNNGLQGQPMSKYAAAGSYLDSEHMAGVPAGEVGQLLSHAPGFVTQGDLLAMIGPALTPRGDTFLIRTYGDAVDKNGRVLARAWLEAVVQRVPEPVTPVGTSGAAQWEPADQFGRKFKVVSLRWLNPEEV